MLKQLVDLLLFMGLCSPSFVQSQTPFSTDSATVYLHTIAVDIGARPMGSPSERKGMEFALNKFREFGLTETYLMPIREYPGYLGGPPTNTRSGVAVGILRGTTGRIIIIGAHMDSVDPDIPGANDDGSGSAVVIELARVLSQSRHESTIVFALFGGEEQGLQGSRYFVDHFPDLSRVVLMLQIDMANGSQLLFPTLDVGDRSSPKWLVRASYEEFSRLGQTGLHFPTDFFVFMGSLPGGGVGSDHEPFLERNIPAIDFTSDARDPIHTPQDNFENFKASGLKRSGDLIYKLFERFDTGVPEEKTGNYFLYQVGSYPVFIPLWSLRAFIIISLILGIVTLLHVRQRREINDGPTRPKIPALKLFLLMLIIQICVWLSENVVSLIKGVRYPWMVDINGYYVLGFFGACIGIWIALQLSPRLRLQHDAYPYYLRSFIFLVIFIALSSISSTKLALYPATAMFLLSLAMLVRPAILKLLFWLLSPHFMFRLFFTEAFDFFGRFMHSQPEITRTINALVVGSYVLFFSIWAFPFLLGFAAVYFDSHIDLLWLKKLRLKSSGVAAAAFFIITAVLLSLEGSYSNEWRPSIFVDEKFDTDSTGGTLTVRSPEYLTNTRLSFVGHDTTIRGSSTEVTFDKVLPAPLDHWVAVSRSVQTTRKDSTIEVEMLLRINMKHRPFRLKVGYSSERARISNVVSPYASSSTSRSISLQWGAFPDSSLDIPISFTLTPLDSLQIKERIEAIFVEEPQPVTVEPAHPSPIIRRTTFVNSAQIGAK